MKKIIIHTDGGSRGNPGQAAYGFTVEDECGELIFGQGKCIGIATNNVAEYSAVFEALKYVKENFRESLQVQVFADSKLVVEQLSGRFKVKSAHLKPTVEKIKILGFELGGISYTYIPREKNHRADALVNRSLDSLK